MNMLPRFMHDEDVTYTSQRTLLYMYGENSSISTIV